MEFDRDHDEQHYPHRHDSRVLYHGRLDVTGHGEVVIEKPLKRSRALFVHSIDVVEVAFEKRHGHHPHPCNPDVPDSLDWELVERLVHHVPELFLKIKWSVSSAQSILWTVYEVE